MTEQNFSALCAKHPFYIPVNEAASFLHIKPEAHRASIDQGRGPFGFSWALGERSGYKIPTVTFVAWLAKGTVSITS